MLALTNADRLCAAGARLHAFRPRSSRRPSDLDVHGRSAVLQASGAGPGFRGLARYVQQCSLDDSGLTKPLCSLYGKSDVQATARALLAVLPLKSAGLASGGGLATVGRLTLFALCSHSLLFPGYAAAAGPAPSVEPLDTIDS